MDWRGARCYGSPLTLLYPTQSIAAGPTGVMAGDNDDAFGERMARSMIGNRYPMYGLTPIHLLPRAGIGPVLFC